MGMNRAGKTIEVYLFGRNCDCDDQEQAKGRSSFGSFRLGARIVWLVGILAVYILAIDMPHVQSFTAQVHGQLQDQIETFEVMAVTDPKNGTLRYTLGMLYQLAGKPREVCDNLHSAYRQDPGAVPPELLHHLANNLKAIGENKAAVEFYSLAIAAIPSAPVNWVLISISLDFIGRSEVCNFSLNGHCLPSRICVDLWQKVRKSRVPGTGEGSLMPAIDLRMRAGQRVLAHLSISMGLCITFLDLDLYS